jgi:hypothetical protein
MVFTFYLDCAPNMPRWKVYLSFFFIFRMCFQFSRIKMLDYSTLSKYSFPIFLISVFDYIAKLTKVIYFSKKIAFLQQNLLLIVMALAFL